MPGSPLLDSPLPIVAAPMAGGPSTVALAAAVRAAGAFPFLAAGYKSAEAMSAEIRELRAVLTGAGFGVNLFVPAPAPVDRAAFQSYAAELAPEAAALSVALDPVPVVDDDQWPDKLALLLADPVPVVSLTFGLPSARDIAALRRTGTRVLATVTTADEARAAAEAGVDALVLQSPTAGGHSGTFDPRRTPSPTNPTDPTNPTNPTDLLAQVRSAVPLPVIATGGIADPSTARALLTAGADAVAIGTLLLRTPESGASPTHKDALADPHFTETVMTHAFTGRPARALRNAFIDRHEPTAPYGYPAIHHLTRPLRQAAAKQGDAERLHLWAGTGFRSARAVPAGEVIADLAAGL